VRASAIVIAASLIAARVSAASPGDRFDPLSLEDLHRMSAVLRRHVAHVKVRVSSEKGQPLQDDTRDGFGIVLAPHRLAVLSFVIQGAKEAKITGPKGSLRARVLFEDVERRVAFLEPESPFDTIGLFPAVIGPRLERDDAVFAIVSTEGDPGVLSGVVTDDARMPEYEGHARVSLELRFGMPVFDDRARFVGYSRTVAWDGDRQMIVTPEVITAARTATTTAALPQAPSQTRPWWAK
jgi:hypothetical protein